MKRFVILLALLSLFVSVAIAQTPQGEQVLQLLQQLRQREGPGTPNVDQVRELERVVRQLQQSQPGDLGLSFTAQRGGRGGRGAAPLPNTWSAGSAWWTNEAQVQRLGLTDDQKARIQRAYENHRLALASNSENVEKEEAQLAKLLQAETIDRNAILTQIDRVTQARAELERTNSAMTLEMREVLTRAQWMQLQGPARVRVGANVAATNLISKVEPAAPSGSQGAVILEVEISKEGVVDSVRVINGTPPLSDAAVAAVKQWRYKPILLNGEPMPVVTTVNVNFGSVPGSQPIQTPFGTAVPGQRRGGRGPQ
jgi:TonB family protein